VHVPEALDLYAKLSERNTSESRAVIGFNSGDFQPGASKDDAAVHVGMLTRDQVDQACPRIGKFRVLRIRRLP
jgi:hypothetical protein